MKRNYQKPMVNVLDVQLERIICSSDGATVYGKSSASGSDQLSRQSGGWTDDDDDY